MAKKPGAKPLGPNAAQQVRSGLPDNLADLARRGNDWREQVDYGRKGSR